MLVYTTNYYHVKATSESDATPARRDEPGYDVSVPYPPVAAGLPSAATARRSADLLLDGLKTSPGEQKPKHVNAAPLRDRLQNRAEPS